MTTWIRAVALLLSSAFNAAAQPNEGMFMSVDASVAELRLNGGLLAALHRTSGRSPKPGEDWVTVHDLTGQQITRVVPSAAIPDASMFTVQEAVATAGTLIVSAYAGNVGEQYANVLLRYELPSGALVRVIRTDPTTCWYLAVDESSVWCLGGDAAAFDQGSKDFDLVYQFTHDGVRKGSAVRWLSEFPDVSFPLTISKHGSPSLVTVEGGVRAWLPRTGRVVTWLPGQALRVTPLSPQLLNSLDSRGNQVVDVGRNLVVTLPGANADNTGHRVALWSDSTAAVVNTSVVLAADTRVVGSYAGRLLLWDRVSQRLHWRDTPDLR